MHKKALKNRKAFSLMELSIVILIIGIITTGITQSSKLVNSFRLSSARNQTQNSPINATTGLVAWYETTSASSFADLETNSGASVTTWNDLNPQTSSKRNLLQLVTASKPTYAPSVANGLPMLRFNGSSQYLETTYGSDLNPANFTIFVVTQMAGAPTSPAGSNAQIISSGDFAAFTGYHLFLTPTSQYRILLGNGTAWQPTTSYAQNASTSQPNLLEATFDGTTYNFYNNGNLLTPAVAPFATFANFRVNTNRVFRVGAGRNENTTPLYYFNGYIGEIVIFDRVLKNDERTSIEEYLIKKWSLN